MTKWACPCLLNTLSLQLHTEALPLVGEEVASGGSAGMGVSTLHNANPCSPTRGFLIQKIFPAMLKTQAPLHVGKTSLELSS